MSGTNQLAARMGALGHVFRRQLARFACPALAISGIAASALLFQMADRIEQERIRNTLVLSVEWRAKDIEHRLLDGLLPISVLGVVLSTEPDPTVMQFRAWVARVAKLGFPVGRLGWEPRIYDNHRDAFERDARQAGLGDYRITELSADGRFVPAKRRDEYFPVRLEQLFGNTPTNMGFDIASTPQRQAALAHARDIGQPVALLPRARQTLLQARPTYVFYSPLFSGGEMPSSIASRRSLLNGYVTALVGVADTLAYALHDGTTVSETLLFTVTSAVAGESDRFVAAFVPGSGVLTGPAADLPPDPTSMVFRREFSVLSQHWVVEFRFPASIVTPLRSYTPWMVAGLGLLVTAGLTGIMMVVMRRGMRLHALYHATMELMQTREQTSLALEAANDQLALRERAAADMAHTRTRFLATASHDLRQPLHALALFTSALRRRVSDPLGRELVDNIAELALSMQRMFNSLLDLSRLDAGAITAQLRPCSTERLVATLFTELQVQAQAKGLELRRTGSFPVVDTDPDLLESVLRNLIGNAIKFTERGAVLIAGRSRGGMSRIEIWDTGRGIAADKLNLIFEEFERLDEQAGRPGFGLGLPIVRRLCAIIGAKLTICSRPGQGSRFAVELPRTIAADTGPAAIGLASELDGLRVLLVDNDDDVQRALSLELEDLGCHVEAASDGEEALARIRGGLAVDLVLLDLGLGIGRRTGWDVADDLRALDPARPIILVTGSTDAATLARIQDSKLPALIKPVTPEKLHQAIAELAGPRSVPG